MGSQKYTNIHPNTTKSLFPNNINNEHVEYQLIPKKIAKFYDLEKNFIINQHIKQMWNGSKRNLQCNTQHHHTVAADQAASTQNTKYTTHFKTGVLWMLRTVFGFLENDPPLSHRRNGCRNRCPTEPRTPTATLSTFALFTLKLHNGSPLFLLSFSL